MIASKNYEFQSLQHQIWATLLFILEHKFTIFQMLCLNILCGFWADTVYFLWKAALLLLLCSSARSNQILLTWSVCTNFSEMFIDSSCSSKIVKFLSKKAHFCVIYFALLGNLLPLVFLVSIAALITNAFHTLINVAIYSIFFFSKNVEFYYIRFDKRLGFLLEF